MKIVITGTTGFVGSHLKSFLEKKQYEVVELNRNAIAKLSAGNVISSEYKGTVWVHLAGKSKDVQKPKLLEEYLEANVALTKKIFHAFLKDESASTFIYVSSVKAAAAKVAYVLTEEDELDVDVPYGLSKRMAEKFLQSTGNNKKKIIVLRPCMIYGPNSNSNLFALYSFIKRGFPYPFAAFNNYRSILSIENFSYAVWKIIENPRFRGGTYNVADDEAISTNEIIKLMGESLKKKPIFLNIPQKIIRQFGILGQKLHLPFNTKVIEKMTASFVVSNEKLVKELGHKLPYQTKESLRALFESFSNKK